LRSGTIASPVHEFTITEKEKTRGFLMNLIGVSGMSGSPVIINRTGEVIGVFSAAMSTEYDKKLLTNGFSIAVPFQRNELPD
jgi:hypothetical protein